MDNNDGPAVSVERLELACHGDYVSQGLAVRRRGFYPVDIAKPFQLKLTWDQLDDGLKGGRHATVRQARYRRATGRRIAVAT